MQSTNLLPNTIPRGRHLSFNPQVRPVIACHLRRSRPTKHVPIARVSSNLGTFQLCRQKSNTPLMFCVMMPCSFGLVGPRQLLPGRAPPQIIPMVWERYGSSKQKRLKTFFLVSLLPYRSHTIGMICGRSEPLLEGVSVGELYGTVAATGMDRRHPSHPQRGEGPGGEREHPPHLSGGVSSETKCQQQKDTDFRTT